MSNKSTSWKAAQKRAKEVAKDPKLTKKLVEQAFEKTKKNPRFLAKARDDFKLFMEMIRAQAKGDYKLGWRSLILAVSSLLYFVMPLDLIPDFILGVGLIDDASILMFALRSLHKDIRLFEAWKKETQSHD